MSSFGLAADLTINLPNGETMDLVYIPAGTFMMGSPTDERGRYDREDLHQVTLTSGYYMGVTEVTQGQWKAVMGSPADLTCGRKGPYGGGPDYPVYCVSWNFIADPYGFVEELNDYLAATSQPGAGLFRLPTEAEWERAARGETQTEFSFPAPPDWDTDCESFPEADPYMVWCGNDNGQAEIAGSKQANPYGLHDMHGNLWEWVEDRWQAHLGYDPVVDPAGPATGSYRVGRGGYWLYFARVCRSANRGGSYPSDRNNSLGFRVARSE